MLTPDLLWPEQKQAIDFLYTRDHTLLLADIGMGKTVMVLTVLKEWLDDGVADRVLVAAPTRVCQQVWRQETEVWSHLAGLNIENLAGETLAVRKRRVAGDAKVLLINYELLPWFMAEYPRGAGCNVMVCDEVDKLKSPTSLRFKGGKLPNGKKAAGMKRYRENFETVIGMTGTPVPNHLLELWSQVYTVDGGSRLGDNYYRYRDAYFYPKKSWAGFTDYALLPGSNLTIEEKIADITFRIDSASGSGDRPEVRELPPRWLDLPGPATQVYKDMEKHYIADVGENTLTALNAGVQYGKLRQIAQGFSYIIPESIRWHSKFKFDELDRLLSELQGQQLMVVYHYQAQADLLRKRFQKRIKLLGGGVSAGVANSAIEEWNAGELPILGVHPQSAGHGLNLQKSHAHHIAMLTLPESAGEYQQVVGRLARTGNNSKYVMVHKIMARKTVDEDRLLAVKGKVLSQDDILRRMKERQS